MDIISFNEAATANGRIDKFIKNPDSNSGIVTVPKVIEAGESVTVPAGRVAVLPNVQVDGILNVEAGGEIFIPAGATFVDLESQIAAKQSKNELAYNVDTSSYIPNTLSSGAIIERGSNTNGTYVKYADGTLFCNMSQNLTINSGTNTFTITIPVNCAEAPTVLANWSTAYLMVFTKLGLASSNTNINIAIEATGTATRRVNILVFGRWR